MFALLAGVSMVATQLIPAGAMAATYSEELQGAYDWAYENGITTMSSIDNANMYGAITRAEMAKMLANYAKNLMGMELDTSAACTFTDTASVKGDLATAIVESCQLGIMGQGITAFRPYDTISRAEFGTALSRLLWGSENEGGTPYYVNHLNALKSAGIMTQIANAESTKEVRGYVMLMLERASALESEADECDDPLVIIACLAGDDSCPAACVEEEEKEPEVVKSGDLAVKAVENEDAYVFSNWVTSELDTLTFKANEDITLNSITLERYGLSDADSIDSIWLEDEDWNKVTAEKSLSTSKDQVTLSFKKDYKDMGKETSFIVVVTTRSAPSTDLWTSIWFKVVDVNSSAENLNLSSYKANLYNFADYTGEWVNVEFKGTAGEKTYFVSEWEMYDVAKMKITATSAAVLVNWFTLTNTADLALDDYIDSIEILRDWNSVKNVTFSAKRNELKISFSDEEIAIKKNATFTVKVSISDEYDRFGEKVNFKLDSEEDLYVVETKNSVRVKVNEVQDGDFESPVTYAFQGWKVSLSNTKLDATISAAQDSDNVLVAEWKISIGGQALIIDEMVLSPDIEEDIDAIRLSINWEEYEATSKNDWTIKKITIDEDATIKVLVDVAVEANTTDTVEITVNGESIFNSASLAGMKYDANNETVSNIAGSISISKLKVQTAKWSLTNNQTKVVEYKVKDASTSKVVFDWTYTAKKQDTNINNVVLTKTAWTISSNDSVTFDIYVNGKKVDSFDFLSTSTSEDSDFSQVLVKAWESVAVRVEANVYASDSTVNDLAFTLRLNGEDLNNNPVSTNAVALAKVRFVWSESITVTTNASIKAQDLVLAQSDQIIGEFIVKPANKASEAILDILEFDVSGYCEDLEEGESADDYFEILVGTTPVEDLELADGELSAEDINIKITGEQKVSVKYKKDLVVSEVPYSMFLETVNEDTNLGKEFLRLAVNTMINVTSQEWEQRWMTKYTFEFDFSDNANALSVQNIRFTYKNPVDSVVSEDEEGEEVIEYEYTKEWPNPSEAPAQYSVSNNEKVNYVTEIYYKDWDGNEVTINATDFPDFFKVGNDDLMAFNSK